MLDLTDVRAQMGFLEMLLARHLRAGCHLALLGFSIHPAVW